MLPASPPESSVIYNLHKPFGSVPLNTLSAEPPEGTGAGAGNPSPPPILVGLKVPDASGPMSGRLFAAASSSVNVMLLAAVLPPTSDIIMAFCPPGPTSNMSTSSGNTWLRLVSVTVTLATVPVPPEISMIDGYGEAAPLGLIVMTDGLHPLGQVPVTFTVKLQAPPPEAVQLTIVVPIGKKDPEGGEQTADPQVPLVVGAG
jgi:hypothetical protein